MKPNRNNRTYFILVLLLLMFVPENSRAQTNLLEPAEIYIGTSHGVNTSMLFFRPWVKQSYLTSYNGGISFRYVTEKHFGLQAELNYVQRGWAEENGVYARRLDYIELPFLTHVYVGNKHRAIINLGPKVGYLLNETTLKHNNAGSTAEQHTAPVHSRFDYGVALGLGYNLLAGKSSVFQLELRGYYGLSDVFANSGSDYFRTSNYFNMSVNIGWFFQLTGKR